MLHPDSPLSDEQVRRLLTRAAELDARLQTSSGVADLRAAATEAGISTLAFDAALREIQQPDASTPRPWWYAVGQNLFAAGAFVLVLKLVAFSSRSLGVAQLGRELGLLIAVLAGIHLADRFGGKLVRTGLIAVGAGQAVLFAFKLAGIVASGPNVLTWAVLFTGIVAAFAAARFGGSTNSSPSIHRDPVGALEPLPLDVPPQHDLKLLMPA